MRKLSPSKKVIVMLFLCAATAIAARAQTFTALADFNNSNGGEPDPIRLVQGTDGNFYGTTLAGGAFGYGAVFKATPDGTVSAIYSFCSQENCSDGYYPSSLTLATDGNFYGTTLGVTPPFPCVGAECGTVFRVTPGGQLTTLHIFTGGHDGETPSEGVVQASDGNFYGTTESSRNGNEDDLGTVFEITAQGHLTTLYTFKGVRGSQPMGGLIQASDGFLYGTTVAGAHDRCWGGCGTIFRISLTGSLTTVYNFHFIDGAAPVAPLLQGSDGNLYGTTPSGGLGCLYGCGTAFKIATPGILTTLDYFRYPCVVAISCSGAIPEAGLSEGTDGKFYGTTFLGGSLDEGTVFQIDSKGTLVILHNFDGTSDGRNPESGILQATSGIFYGTATYGGLDYCSLGCGSFFSVDMGLGPFVAFVQPAGKVSATAEILGQNFTGTTSVSFNGTPASFMVESDTYLTATVPPGATTGYVSVTTPSGTLTSNVPFHVLK